MKKMLKGFSIIVMLIMVLSCGSNDEGLEKVTVAYHPHVNGIGAALLAVENGYFEEEGLEIEFVEFTNGATELAAMASGNIDFGFIGMGAHVFFPRGQATILALDSTDLNGSQILVTTESGIEEPKDLEGKTIAITSGTTSEMVSNIALDMVGLTPEDVRFVSMEAASKVTAIESGQVDAVAIEPPFSGSIISNMGDKVKVLINSSHFYPEKVLMQSWCATPQYIEENQETVQKFVNALVKGLIDKNSDINAANERVAAYLDLSVESVEEVSKTTRYIDPVEMKHFAQDGTFFKWYDAAIDEFVNVGMLDEEFNVPAQEYSDFSYFLNAFENAGM